MGRHFGVQFHVEAQRRIIVAAGDLIGSATRSSGALDQPVRSADLHREGVEIERRPGER